jgi:Peptidase_C39 like family
MIKTLLRISLALWAASLSLKAQEGDKDARGIQFLSFRDFGSFTTSTSESNETVLVSQEIPSSIAWDELIASWNVQLSSNGYVKIEARAFVNDRPTKYYTLGLWSGDNAPFARASVRHQRDDDGTVDTDTLKLQGPSSRLQLRVILGNQEVSSLKFIGVCVSDSRTSCEALSPNRLAWGKSIAVPEKSQMAYPNGGVLCSPTTISMLLAYWSKQLNRSDLNHDVPEVARQVFDPNWEGTGNWAFNTAYAGSFEGMTAVVTRFSDVSELEDWISSGLPVGVSLCYNKLRGKGGAPSGHLVVCVGFTSDGDVILNDPGTSHNVRKTFPRKNLIAAWAHSRNTVYLVYPTSEKLPTDRFGHWESPQTPVVNRKK